MDHSKKQTYLFSIDALRAIAILGVVMIHLTTKTLGVVNLDPNLAPFSLFLNQISRFAVPLFFFISGFVLELNNQGQLSYVRFIKRRASRIIIPFLFWSAFYYLLAHQISQFFSYNFVLTLIQGKASYQLYFIPTLIIFYIIFPPLHSIINFLKKPLVLSSLVVIQVFIVSYDYYYKNLSLPYDFRISSLVWIMFLLGILASHFKDAILKFVKKNFLTLSTILFLFLPLLFYHSKLLFLSTRRIGYIYSQYHLLNYIYTLLFAGVISFVLERRRWGRKFFIALSKLSFFVFFVHVFILENVWKYFVQPQINSHGVKIVENFWFDPLLFFIISAISFTVAYIIHEIPFASRVTG